MLRVYRMIEVQPQLKDSSAILKHFHDISKNGHIGTIVKIENALAKGHLNQAISFLNSVNPQNDIESNFIDFYKAYIHYKDSSYTVADSIILKTLVDGCPVRDGMAVRKARALYSMIYSNFTMHTDNCTDDAIVKTVLNNINKIPVIKNIPNLYPNPTTGDIWIQFDKGLNGKNAYICIYNIIGSLVFKENISISNTNKIAPNLEDGTYFISIHTDDATIKNYNAKIIVIK